MSLRLLPVLLLACLAASPVVLAQGPAQANPELTMDIDHGVESNDTLAVIPFTVNLSVSQFACVGTGASFTVSLSVTAEEAEEMAHANATDGNTTDSTGEPSATVSPATLTFQAPAGSGLSGAFSDSAPATLTVEPSRPGWASNVTATVTATVTGVSNCAGADVNDASATEQTTVAFEAPSFVQQDEPDGAEMPGFGLLALVAALGVALVVRRKA